MPETIFINGSWRSAQSGKTFPVRNPATLEVLGECSDGDARSACEASAAASSAFPVWAATTAEGRAALLQKLAHLLERDAGYFCDLLVSESGKRKHEAVGEVTSSVAFLKWNAEEARRCYGQVLQSPRPGVRMWTIRQPVGVVAAITPWNYPLNTSCRKLGPALAAGCTVVVKPAPETPLSTVALVQRAEAAGFPPGVLNLVTTSQAAEVVGAWLADRKVRKIAFTGSTAVGKQLLRDSAETMKRVSLELGGHAPVLVFKDADLEAAAEAIVASRFRHAGQTCICAQRVLVEETVADALLALLKTRVEQLRVGNGKNPDVEVGPLIHEAAQARVQSHLDDAVGSGAFVVTGGKRLSLPQPNRGCFFAPTLLDRVRPEMRIMQEETFGPILTMTRFSSEEEAIQQANATNYGLVAYAFTNDLSRTYRLIDKLEFGTVGINEVQIVAPHLPFGGIKYSGLGRENGQEGIAEYLDIKSAVLGIQENPQCHRS